jgi:hypothetical protein
MMGKQARKILRQKEGRICEELRRMRRNSGKAKIDEET